MRKIKHVYATNDQWVRVHRYPSTGPRSADGSEWIIKAVLGVAGIWFGVCLLSLLVKLLMPILILGVGGIFLFSK